MEHTRARIVIFERVPGTSIWWPASPQLTGEREPGVIVAGSGAFSFLNAYRFRRDILPALRSAGQNGAADRPGSDRHRRDRFTAAQILRDLIRRAHADGVDFAIARLESIRAQAAMARFGIDELLGPGHSFRSVEEAVKAPGGKAPARAG